MFRHKLLSISLFFLVGLTGCTSGTSNSSDSTEVVDIENIVLTNMSGDCSDYVSKYSATVSDLNQRQEFISQFDVTEDGQSCSVYTNVIPNYDFDDFSAHFASNVSEQDMLLNIPRNPEKAEEPSALNMLFYDAVMLNGVVLDQLSDGCYKPEDENADLNGNIAAGCGLWVDWRLNPMGTVDFGTDSHNAHVQPGGIYHYHGNPLALFDPEETDQGSPVIGFAADGFPIYGPHYLDSKTGEMKEAVSGYTLKSGSRPNSEGSPGGTYDGTYIEDFEFTNAGTLDRCNGMTIDGQYGYYVTESYPYVMACFTGSPDKSFFKFWTIAKWVVTAIVVSLTLIVILIVILVKKRRSKNKEKLNPKNSTESKE